MTAPRSRWDMPTYMTAKRATTSAAAKTPTPNGHRLPPLHANLPQPQRSIGNQALGRLLRQARLESPRESVDWSAPPIVHEVLNDAGQPLDPGVRAFMEER